MRISDAVCDAQWLHANSRSMVNSWFVKAIIVLSHKLRNVTHNRYASFSNWAAEPLSGQAELLIDTRGMGQGIADILENMGAPFMGVMTTAGDRENSYRSERGTPYFTIPKRNLVNAALVPYQQGRLRFLPGPHAEQLKQELANFVPRQNERTGHVRYEAATGEHDDIVFSLLLCCWGARRLAGKGAGVDEKLAFAETPYHGRSFADDRADFLRDLPIDPGPF